MNIITIIIIIVLLCISFVFFLSLLFILPNIGLSRQFKGIKKDDVEKVILNNQIERLRAVGIILPSYEVQFKVPTTDLNGSFYGAIMVKFNEPLSYEYIADFKKRIDDSDPMQLWYDKHIITQMKLSEHILLLIYTRKEASGSHVDHFRCNVNSIS